MVIELLVGWQFAQHHIRAQQARPASQPAKQPANPPVPVGPSRNATFARRPQLQTGWAEAPIKIARMTLTIKLDGNWSSFQLANSAPPLSVTDSAIAPSARMEGKFRDQMDTSTCGHLGGHPTTNSSILACVGRFNKARRDPSKLPGNARETCLQHSEREGERNQ